MDVPSGGSSNYYVILVAAAVRSVAAVQHLPLNFQSFASLRSAD
eukprot:SAG11_NODE_1551_length_4697_cov_10.474554_2_plen_44_part_00